MPSKRIVKALETLVKGKELGSRSVFREVDPVEIRKRSITDQLFLQMPWLASKLKREELSRVIHWCFMIRDKEAEEERQRLLDGRDVETKERLRMANIARLRLREERRLSDVHLTMTRAEKLEKLVKNVARGHRTMRRIQKAIDAERKKKGLPKKSKTARIKLAPKTETVGRIPIRRRKKL